MLIFILETECFSDLVKKQFYQNHHVHVQKCTPGLHMLLGKRPALSWDLIFGGHLVSINPPMASTALRTKSLPLTMVCREHCMIRPLLTYQMGSSLYYPITPAFYFRRQGGPLSMTRSFLLKSLHNEPYSS